MPGYPVLVGHQLSARLEPTNIHSAANRTALEPGTPAKQGVIASQPDQPAHDLQQLPVNLISVDPRELVLLAVLIVVFLLRLADVVTHQPHWHALREETCGQAVTFLLR